jgi:hypothetical protein
MPKAKPKPARRTRGDVVQNARRVVEVSIGGPLSIPQEEPSKETISQVMAEMGRRGGKIGGKRRLETLTKEERRQIALKAAKARWAKKR